ncbi:hypothetical protein NDK50_27035 [Paraburkholderia bryophila]|jgi:hypothetical protein|uniref:Uncharacterized protein n=1 Tax=Paraburkholderia bryophila TaxID=420952 RepID=A0A329CER3_9BURK|nr:hypothetical protein [Paraburkholderia bryophila]RAS33283.1 hypothetical protein BX591_107200 [Paraburkholderia bryophila]WCM24466.1 hypothetical protein NDK50_27035 [Paraburkholderia bryophila]
MKFLLWVAMASAVLLLVPISVGAQQADSATGDGMSGRTLMQRNANESVQATTDMSFGEAGQAVQGVRNASYGGVAAGQSEMGGRPGQPCSSGPLCRVYFGQ